MVGLAQGASLFDQARAQALGTSSQKPATQASSPAPSASRAKPDLAQAYKDFLISRDAGTPSAISPALPPVVAAQPAAAATVKPATTVVPVATVPFVYDPNEPLVNDPKYVFTPGCTTFSCYSNPDNVRNPMEGRTHSQGGYTLVITRHGPLRATCTANSVDIGAAQRAGRRPEEVVVCNPVYKDSCSILEWVLLSRTANAIPSIECRHLYANAANRLYSEGPMLRIKTTTDPMDWESQWTNFGEKLTCTTWDLAFGNCDKEDRRIVQYDSSSIKFVESWDAMVDANPGKGLLKLPPKPPAAPQ